MTMSRAVKESPLVQGEDEKIAYTITTTPWASSPSAVVVAVKETSEASDVWTDVTTTKTSGAASVTGDVITTPKIISLTRGLKYRVEVKFTSGGNQFECYFEIVAER
jgi:hypothetical protein